MEKHINTYLGIQECQKCYKECEFRTTIEKKESVGMWILMLLTTVFTPTTRNKMFKVCTHCGKSSKLNDDDKQIYLQSVNNELYKEHKIEEFLEGIKKIIRKYNPNEEFDLILTEVVSKYQNIYGYSRLFYKRIIKNFIETGAYESEDYSNLYRSYKK